MTLSDQALTTVAAAESRCGSTLGAVVLEPLIEACSEAFQSVADREFYAQSDLVELVAGSGLQRLVLRNAPVTAVDSVKLIAIDDTELDSYDSDGYRILEDEGILYRPGGWPDCANYYPAIEPMVARWNVNPSLQVTYDCGYITPNQSGTRNLPYLIERMVLDSVFMIWKTQNIDPSLGAKTTQQVSTSWRQPDRYDKAGLTPKAYEYALSLRRKI